eukprot:TRINITY_DN3460_c0_g1_i1.p1 TRINITY_DN3460_c0_g1~~TRINITY_DN3460_c0_g1_i1.p1  ORF type:complete len:131 (-),score=12.93 TRINITY_DN3460_c0_g1_i1:30-422(-)
MAAGFRAHSPETSHTSSWPSWPAVATRVPLGEKLRRCTPPVWPRSAATWAPVLVPHTATGPTPAAATRRPPNTRIIEVDWSAEDTEHLLLMICTVDTQAEQEGQGGSQPGDVPHKQLAVVACRGHTCAAG